MRFLGFVICLQSFKHMVGTCLLKDPSRRPSAKKLLKHSFFKQARSSDYISRTLLEGLPTLGDRNKDLKVNTIFMILIFGSLYSFYKPALCSLYHTVLSPNAEERWSYGFSKEITKWWSGGDVSGRNFPSLFILFFSFLFFFSVAFDQDFVSRYSFLTSGFGYCH